MPMLPYFTTDRVVGTIESSKKDTRFEATLTAGAHNGSHLLFASFFGNATSVDAIRATIALGKEIKLHIKKDSAWPLGLKTKGIKYKVAAARLKPTKRDHLVVIADVLVEDTLGGNVSYVMCPMGESAQPYVSERLRELLPVVVLPEWDVKLYNWATTTMVTGGHERLVHEVKQDGTNIWKITLDKKPDPPKPGEELKPPPPPQWETYISQSVKSGAFAWVE